MRRDIPNVSLNESVGFSIDTFNDRRNGYLYEVNALGGFLDAQVTNEGMPPNSNWNSVFNVQVGRFEGGWTFEFRVPFWSIRYAPGPNPSGASTCAARCAGRTRSRTSCRCRWRWGSAGA